MQQNDNNEFKKKLSFEKTKLITRKLLCPHNNLIIIIGSANQNQAQMLKFQIIY